MQVIIETMESEMRLVPVQVRINPASGPEFRLQASSSEFMEMIWPAWRRKMGRDIASLDVAAPQRRFCRAVADRASNTECPVCLEPFRTNKRVRILPCNHAMCDKCTIRSLSRDMLACPMCRHPIIESEPLTVFMFDPESCPE
tara:strand:- start:2401 stop:2829 length:429 start_codon:yes stop_codon:yes gene_type:complete